LPAAMAAREDRGSKARRRVARTLVATYPEAELGGLVEHVAEAIERYRAGELDVHDVDEVIHRCHKARRRSCGSSASAGVGRVRRDSCCDTRAPNRERRAAGLVGGVGASAAWLGSAGCR